MPPPPTEDYYTILEVVETATIESITRSYRRLALKLHPDRNTQQNTTQSFQILGRAYETLKDENKRREYDLIYPSIKRHHTSRTSQTPRPAPVPTPQSETLNEAAQLAALRKSKQEREARWRTKKNIFDSSVFEISLKIQQLQQEIKNLESIAAAEAAEEAQKNSWTTWLLSPLYKKLEDSEEEKARKDRERQERRIEKDMKERRLESSRADLRTEEILLKQAKEEVDAADRVDNWKIQAILNKQQARETAARQERERVERERQAKIRELQEKVRKQQRETQERLEREAAERRRKQQEEERVAQQKRQEEYLQAFWEEYESPTTRQSACVHDGWWSKLEGRTPCPKCFEVWTYLLQCPSCQMEACPRCQADLRPRRRRRTVRRAPPRSPSPEFYSDPWRD